MNYCVDIIMPVYNCEEYVKEAIESVKKQTFSNWRLIIVEDASTDNTLSVINDAIENIKEKVLLITLEKNVGVASARNIGIEKANSRYIAFLDSDDIWEEKKLENQINFMDGNDYAFSYTLFTYLKNERKKKVKYFPKSLNYKQALGNTYILTSTVLIDTNKITKNILSMPNVESEDTGAWWNILRNGNIAYGLKENLVTYRVRNDGLSSNKYNGLKKTWKLYRNQEKLSIIKSIFYLIKYVFHASIKRVI